MNFIDLCTPFLRTTVSNGGINVGAYKRDIIAIVLGIFLVCALGGRVFGGFGNYKGYSGFAAYGYCPRQRKRYRC